MLKYASSAQARRIEGSVARILHVAEHEATRGNDKSSPWLLALGGAALSIVAVTFFVSYNRSPTPSRSPAEFESVRAPRRPVVPAILPSAETRSVAEDPLPPAPLAGSAPVAEYSGTSRPDVSVRERATARPRRLAARRVAVENSLRNGRPRASAPVPPIVPTTPAAGPPREQSAVRSVAPSAPAPVARDRDAVVDDARAPAGTGERAASVSIESGSQPKTLDVRARQVPQAGPVQDPVKRRRELRKSLDAMLTLRRQS